MRLIVPLVLFTLFIASCSPDAQVKNQSGREAALPTLFRLVAGPNGPMINQGDTVAIAMELADTSQRIDHWSWTVNGKATDYSTPELSWSSQDQKLGSYSFSLTAHLENGKTQTKTIIKEVAAAREPIEYTYEVIQTFPHDPEAYTQGFFLHDGVLYEGTGLRGQSSLREVDLKTGKVNRSYNIPERFFGEGITIKDNKIYQLTWQGKTGFIYDLESFQPIREFQYNTDGWGITHNDTALFMSDGSHRIYVLDPDNLTELGVLEVFNERARMINLNELEWINGEIWANIYGTDYIAIIDPKDGSVLKMVDLTDIFDRRAYRKRADVLNGIAYNPESELVLVTGKLWPNVYEIRIIPKN